LKPTALKIINLSWKLKSIGEYKHLKSNGKVINSHEILEEYVTKLYNKAKKKTRKYIKRLKNSR